MVVEVIRTYYRYGAWANERIFDAAAGLTREQLTAPGTAGHGSIRETLLHLLRTQLSWLSWWNGALPAEEAMRLRLEPDDHPDVAALRARWVEIERQTREYIDSLTEEEATRAISQATPRGQTLHATLWQLMLHVGNHGTQHRSEVAAMLTACGHSPGGLDLLFYLMAAGAGA